MDDQMPPWKPHEKNIRAQFTAHAVQGVILQIARKLGLDAVSAAEANGFQYQNEHASAVFDYESFSISVTFLSDDAADAQDELESQIWTSTWLGEFDIEDIKNTEEGIVITLVNPASPPEPDEKIITG